MRMLSAFNLNPLRTVAGTARCDLNQNEFESSQSNALTCRVSDLERKSLLHLSSDKGNVIRRLIYNVFPPLHFLLPRGE